MKKTIIIILLNIFLTGFIFAEITLNYSKNAGEYKQNILNNKIICHRSGLLYSQEELFDEDLPIVEFPEGFDNTLSSDELIEIWNDKIFAEYRPVFDESQGELAQFIEEYLENDFMVKYNETLNVIVFERDVQEGQTVLQSIDEYVDKSNNFINDQLSVFKGRLEFENTITEYVQCLSTPEGGSSPKEIASVQIRYRRLFQGRILSNDVSYLQIEINKSGDVISVSVKWPKLKITATDETESSIKILQYLENLILNVKCLDPQKDIHTATVEGIALIYRRITKENQTVITPVYSYLVRLDYSDGSMDYDFFDAPVLQYGWESK